MANVNLLRIIKVDGSIMKKLAVKIYVFLVAVLCMAGTRNVYAAASQGVKQVDLVIFSGQSNMAGGGGDALQAPAVPKDHGYEFRCGKVATGMYEIVEPFGIYQDGYLSDPDGIRKGSLVSDFANAYYKNTGVPILALSATRSGSSINYWLSSAVKAELMEKYDLVNSWCEANFITIRHRYVVWLQGETDGMAGMSTEEYEKKLVEVFMPLINKGLDQVFVIPVGHVAGLPAAYETVAAAQMDLCANSPYFTMATDTLRSLPDMYLPDTVHYNQSALNLVGKNSGVTAAVFSKALDMAARYGFNATSGAAASEATAASGTATSGAAATPTQEATPSQTIEAVTTPTPTPVTEAIATPTPTAEAVTTTPTPTPEAATTTTP